MTIADWKTTFYTGNQWEKEKRHDFIFLFIKNMCQNNPTV